MAIDPYESVATHETSVNGAEPAPPEAAVAVAPAEQEPVAAIAQAAEAIPAPTVQAIKPSRPRPRWVVPAAIAAVGLIASGTLGYLFYSTSNKLDATRHQLAVTQANLTDTSGQLAAAKSDAADKKIVADYVKMYNDNAGKVRTDYGQLFTCDNYPTCRMTAQQELNDLQAFQSARQSATVPSSLSDSDSALGDSLSAAITAIQEVITGMDNDSKTKLDDGYNKLDAAMLSLAKAEATLGEELQ